MVDTHTHLNFQAFSDDWREVVERAVEAGVEKMVVVGTDLVSSQRAVEMADEQLALYAAVGIHPHHVKSLLPQASDIQSPKQPINSQIFTLVTQLRKLATHPKTVAIGEVGLDYHTYQATKYTMQNTKEEWGLIKSLQKEMLRQQVALAAELEKPLILHSREAGGDVLDLLQATSEQQSAPLRGVFHCFDGSKKYMRRILEAGWHVSFTGNVTYNEDRARVADEVPLDRLLLETDCPFMVPEPKRSIGGGSSQSPLRSEPADVRILAEFHTRRRNMSLRTFEAAVTRNSNKLFRL